MSVPHTAPSTATAVQTTTLGVKPAIAHPLDPLTADEVMIHSGYQVFVND